MPQYMWPQPRAAAPGRQAFRNPRPGTQGELRMRPVSGEWDHQPRRKVVKKILCAEDQRDGLSPCVRAPTNSPVVIGARGGGPGLAGRRCRDLG